MNLTVRFFAGYRDLTGCKTLETAAPADLRQLLHWLADRFGPPMRDKLFSASDQLGMDAVILINGRHIAHLQGLDTPLQAGDVVGIFPLVAGG